MAYIGLRKPLVFALNAETGKYSAPIAFGRAIDFNYEPQSSEAALYCNDVLGESEKSVTSANLTLGIAEVPDACKESVYGHTKESDNSYTYNVDDEAVYCGFGIIAVRKIQGVRTFVGQLFPKVQFSAESVTIQTRGESTSFTTPSVSATALPNDDGDLLYEFAGESEDAVIAWMKTKLGITG